MKTIETLDTRDLYTRKCELESLRDAVESARDDLREALVDYGFSKDEVEEGLQENTLPPSADGHEWTDENDLTNNILDLLRYLSAAKEDYDQDAQDELAELETLENEVGVSNFMHGTQLIPSDGFEDHARELAEDTYGDAALKEWPGNCIDWKQAAEELQSDYSIASYQGTDYYFRD